MAEGATLACYETIDPSVGWLITDPLTNRRPSSLTEERKHNDLWMPFESQFGDCADDFQRYRPECPPALYARMFSEIPAPDRKCAMDLGTGTAIVTRHLGERFQEVIAVESDAVMTAKITERLPRLTIRQTMAEECVQPRETVDWVTIGNAPH